ncbi:MAG: ATP-binding protein [Pseudomonadota bacterium]
MVHVKNWKWNSEDGAACCSEETSQILDCPFQQVTSFEQVLKHIHPEDKEAVIQVVEESLQSSADCKIEYRIVRPDGDIHYIYFQGHVTEWTGNKPLKIAGTLRDITEHKLAEKKLAESETKFRTLFEASSDAIMLLDERGFFDCNPATIEMFGCSDVEVFSKLHPSELSPPTQPDGSLSVQAAQQKIEQAFREGRNFFEWMHWRFDDHREFPAEVLLTAMRLGERDVLQAVVRDITQRKQAEQSIIMAKEAAESATKAKSEFLANMSHEIRTPMNGVVSMSQVLLDSGLDKKQREYAMAITRSASSLVLILNDILDLAKIESRKIEITMANFPIEDLAQHCLDLFLPLAEEKGLSFYSEIEVGSYTHVFTDLTRLIQITSNLLSNAVKFTEQGRIRFTIKLRELEGENLLLRVEVEDSGEGIPAEEQQHIFDRFVQVSDGYSKRYAGTGLGLTISSELLNQMKGRIWVTSELGKGSCFYFEVPLKRAEMEIKTVTLKSDMPILNDQHILVVDDDDIGRMGAALLLRNRGFQVSTANNGNQAIELIRKETFDVVLMDIHMPELNGMEVTRCIREDSDPDIARLPVIGLTAAVLKDEHQLYLESGMNSVLAKPLDIEKVKAALFDIPMHSYSAQ